jgi:transposase
VLRHAACRVDSCRTFDFHGFIEQTAKPPRSASAARPGGEYFAAPAEATQRRYEALRAYLHDGLPASEAARRFGYTETSLASMARDFRAGRRDFFLTAKPGPKSAPTKDAARERIIELRQHGRSAYEIAAVLTAEGIALNRTGVAEVLAEEGFGRLWPRPHADRGLPRREPPERTGVIDFAELPARAETKLAGLLLAIPDLISLDLPALVTAAGYPGTKVIPALGSILSLLALKLTGTRRVSHVEDCATDPAAALFAGLTSLPKATALSTYSYRLAHDKQAKFLAALDQASLSAGLPTARRSTSTSTPSGTGAKTPRWKSTTCPEDRNAPARCSPSSPRTPPATPCSTPTPTCPKQARTTRSSPSPTTGTPSPATTRNC